MGASKVQRGVDYFRLIIGVLNAHMWELVSKSTIFSDTMASIFQNTFISYSQDANHVLLFNSELLVSQDYQN